MARLNITLDQDEMLALLANNSGEAFRTLLEKALNQILLAESEEQLKAAPYERTEDRTDSRNGFRDREYTTRIGTLTMHVPRHRNQPFKTMIFENYCRSEAALVASMTEMVINGVSTRKVSKVVETLCGTSFSKSTVSDLCKDLSVAVKEFRNRPLTENYPFLTVDATYFKVRENHRIVSKAFMIALATNDQGHREIIGFGVYHNESKDTWNDFLNGLKKRGLKGLLMITSDAHEGKAPKKYQTGIRAELNEMFNCQSLEDARNVRDSILDDYRDVAESAMNCLEEGFESAMTIMALPKHLRRYYRTSNHIERLNKELKRRSKVIGIFPSEDSLLRLMGSVLIEQNDLLQVKKAIFSPKTYAELVQSEVPGNLVKIAGEQRLLQAA